MSLLYYNKTKSEDNQPVSFNVGFKKKKESRKHKHDHGDSSKEGKISLLKFRHMLVVKANAL